MQVRGDALLVLGDLAYQNVVVDDNHRHGTSSHDFSQAERMVAEAFDNQTKACTWRCLGSIMR